MMCKARKKRGQGLHEGGHGLRHGPSYGMGEQGIGLGMALVCSRGQGDIVVSKGEQVRPENSVSNSGFDLVILLPTKCSTQWPQENYF